jgi:hypothetical protein
VPVPVVVASALAAGAIGVSAVLDDGEACAKSAAATAAAAAALAAGFVLVGSAPSIFWAVGWLKPSVSGRPALLIACKAESMPLFSTDLLFTVASTCVSVQCNPSNQSTDHVRVVALVMSRTCWQLQP